MIITMWIMIQSCQADNPNYDPIMPSTAADMKPCSWRSRARIASVSPLRGIDQPFAMD